MLYEVITVATNMDFFVFGLGKGVTGAATNSKGFVATLPLQHLEEHAAQRVDVRPTIDLLVSGSLSYNFV